MKRKISLPNRFVDYLIHRSARAKRLRLAVHSDGKFIVTIPQRFPSDLVDKYIIAKSKWITSKFDYYEKLNSKKKLILGDNSFELYKDKALKLVNKRLTAINRKYYQYKFNKITIKNHKTRWGSCTGKRNLNFNYKILFLPPVVRDYIVVHELCHLKEHNHSNRFWLLVAISMPDYANVTKVLKEKGVALT